MVKYFDGRGRKFLLFLLKISCLKSPFQDMKYDYILKAAFIQSRSMKNTLQFVVPDS